MSKKVSKGIRPPVTHKELRPRFNSKLDYLSEEARQNLLYWLLNTQMRMIDCVEKLKTDYGVETSLMAVSKFFKKYGYSTILQRRDQSRQLAETLFRQTVVKPGKFYDAAMDQLERRGMELALDDKAAAKDITQLLNTMIQYRKQVLEEKKLHLMDRRLQIIERKLTEQEDRAGERKRVNDKQFIERMRKIFKREEISTEENSSEISNGHRNGVST